MIRTCQTGKRRVCVCVCVCVCVWMRTKKDEVVVMVAFENQLKAGVTCTLPDEVPKHAW